MNEKEIIVSGNNLELTDALKSEATSKLSKLFTLDERIIRLRVDLQYDANKHKDNEFIARGHIEIQGPDMVVSVASDNMYKSLDLLLNKLIRKIRRRHRLEKVKRNKKGIKSRTLNTIKYRENTLFRLMLTLPCRITVRNAATAPRAPCR